ncbi:hypothetical protein ACA910_014003 [Epithemia clementina (nom. ined.)]
MMGQLSSPVSSRCLHHRHSGRRTRGRAEQRTAAFVSPSFSSSSPWRQLLLQSTSATSPQLRCQQWQLNAQPAGSFFNPVPRNNDDDNDDDNNKDTRRTNNTSTETLEVPSLDSYSDPFDSNIVKLLRERKAPSLASQPSTINGKPTSGQGFGSVVAVKKEKNPRSPNSKPYIAVGPQSLLNDPSKPEYDDQGYTLYANEETGEKSRVFEALVDYPCFFTLKIVGANEGNFVLEMVAVVAESCQVQAEQVPHSYRALGKWLSVTVQAPVQSAEMLYQLYENVDRDPRVKFKF